MSVWILVAAGLAFLASFALGLAIRFRAQRDAERARRAAQEREGAPLQRMAVRLHEEHQFISHALNEIPHLTRELHAGIEERRIPGILLNTVQRVLEPRQVVVLLRRRQSLADGSRSPQLVVAASAPEGLVRSGTELTIGTGEIGFAAEVQRTLSRADLDGQPAPIRARLKQDAIPGFDLQLVAPLVVGETTVGVIALSRPREDWPHTRSVLRLIAQIGGLALHDSTAYAQMKVSADVDGLTQVFNKRHLTRVLGEAVFEAQQSMAKLSVFLFDIDHFKNYNDVNGHVAGDHLLQLLARLVKENTRRQDVFGRFGGEEFLLILKGAGAQQALAAAENLRAIIAACPFPEREKQPLGCLSVSGGVAEYPKHGTDSNQLLRAADAALYEAKRQGRNRVAAAATRGLGDDADDFDQVFDAGSRGA